MGPGMDLGMNEYVDCIYNIVVGCSESIIEYVAELVWLSVKEWFYAKNEFIFYKICTAMHLISICTRGCFNEGSEGLFSDIIPLDLRRALADKSWRNKYSLFLIWPILSPRVKF